VGTEKLPPLFFLEWGGGDCTAGEQNTTPTSLTNILGTALPSKDVVFQLTLPFTFCNPNVHISHLSHACHHTRIILLDFTAQIITIIIIIIIGRWDGEYFMLYGTTE
jgi:hypothetical protein